MYVFLPLRGFQSFSRFGVNRAGFYFLYILYFNRTQIKK